MTPAWLNVESVIGRVRWAWIKHTIFVYFVWCSRNKDTRPSKIVSLTLFIYSIKDTDRKHDHHIIYPSSVMPANKDTEETTLTLPMNQVNSFSAIDSPGAWAAICCGDCGESSSPTKWWALHKQNSPEFPFMDSQNSHHAQCHGLLQNGIGKKNWGPFG